MKRFSLGILLLIGCGAQRLVVGSRDGGVTDTGAPPQIDAADAATVVDPCLVLAGSFATAAQPFSSIVATDLNGDGKVDLLVPESGGGEVFLGHGNGSFAPGVAFPGGMVGLVSVADLDGDGKPDIAGITSDNGSATGIEVLRGNGDGTFGPPVVQPFDQPLSVLGLAIVDLDRNGHPDLVLATLFTPVDGGASGGESVLVMLGNGDATFRAPATYDPGAGPVSGGTELIATDLNSDGNPDLVMIVADGATINVLLGVGDGTLRPGVSWPTSNSSPAFPWAFVPGDVDGDGKVDLVVQNASPSTLAMLRGKGDGTFTGVAEYPIPDLFAWSVGNMVLGDIDGRRGPDVILLANPDTTRPAVDVMFNDGQGGFGAPIMLSNPPPTFPPGSPVAFAVADLDGDHHPDLAVVETNVNGTSNTIQIYRNTCGALPGPQ
jgi:hypothetical protein